ncbi:diaminopimelate epimerase [Anaeroselena agilis]|uniref:Diaminopimelate epimerase n=1 Tax=Anaeroselena agilis TaxID=3063788 RepID=A0ABU3P301_9FIRM|nr:diaminopimelate epimerase [Selenomonadales bacterium 4137-cl]
MPTDFYKYHALGNDYIVIDPNKSALALSEENIRLICHRNFGVGSDGILFGPLLEAGGMRLRILNPDGSEAEKSGNGIRIFSRYLVEAGYVKGKEFSLITAGGTVAVAVLDGVGGLIKVDMGAASFSSADLPASGPAREIFGETLALGEAEYTINCVSMGNPHCVIPLDDISRETAERLGPLVENHPLFPRRTNVQFLKVIDRANIRIEIWERGAGYTLASGSSSCAAASVAHRLGLTGPEVKVHMPGGVIDIDIRPDGHVFMTGPVTGVMTGSFAPDLRRQVGLGAVKQ